MKDRTGQRFGRWVVLEMMPGGRPGSPMVRCRCDCGTESVIGFGNLRDGRSASCGCYRREFGRSLAKPRANLVGSRFGRAIVLEYRSRPLHGASRTGVWCRCDCGKEFFARPGRLLSGHTTNCGCQRKSKYPSLAAYLKRRSICLRVQDLCIDCKSPKEADYLSIGRCQTCSDKAKQRKKEIRNEMRARRAAYVARGICLACTKNPVVDGLKRCQSCRDSHRELRERYARMGRCICGSTDPLVTKTLCQKCADRCVRRQRRLRDEVFAAYGGYRCRCCGETTPEFLHIDHVHNDGAEHRRRIGSGSRIYEWLRKNQFPPGFQVLCANCNLAKGHYGCCPHQRDREFACVMC